MRRSVVLNRERKSGVFSKVMIMSIIGFMIISAAPTAVATSVYTIEFNFVDQYGNDLTGAGVTGNERILVDYHGYLMDGDSITVTSGSTIYYRAYFEKFSGLYGPKYGHVVTGAELIDVVFVKLEMNFINQDGDPLTPPEATGNERVLIDYVGYKADGEYVSVPDSATLYYRAYYQQFSGLYGPKESVSVDDLSDTLEVNFITFQVEFTPGLPYTGDERVLIDYVGYKGNFDMVTVPRESTIYYRMYFKQFSGLYGTKNSLFVITGNVDFDHNFKSIEINFVDEDGFNIVSPPATGNEVVLIDYVGYRSNGDVIVVPDDGILHYRAYYQQFSGLYGPKLTVNIEDLLSPCDSPINPYDSDLIAYWRMDEESGLTAIDSTVYDNHGTINGATRVSGVYGNALSFDGTNDYIQVPDANILEPMTVTVESWVKSESAGSYAYILGKGGDTCRAVSYGIYTGGSGGLHFYIYDGSVYVLSPNAGTSLWDDQWHHVAGTYDGTRVRLYVDGTEIGTGTPTTRTIGYGLPTFDHLLIGAYRGTCNFYYEGELDEMAIWSRALSLEEIQAHYHGLAPHPVAQYHFEEGFGTTTYDSTPNNNDGTLNSPDWTNDGITGKALEYNGIDDKVEVPHDASLSLDTEYTIEAWFQRDLSASNSLQYIVAKDTDSPGLPFSNYNLLLFNSKPALFLKGLTIGAATKGTAYSDSGGGGIVGVTSVLDEEWHYIACVYTGTELNVYLDGELDGSVPVSGTPYTSTDDLWIGSRRSATYDKGEFLGKIDEVTLWDVALSGAAIKANYNEVFQPPVPISHWSLDEGSGTTAYDSYPNHNDGTVYGSPSWPSGISGSAMNFDGTNDYIKVPDDNTLDFGPGDDFSLGAWFKAKPDQARWQGTIFAKLSDVSISPYKRSFGYSMMVRGVQDIANEGKVGLWVGDGDASDGFFKLYSEDTYDDDKWHYAVATVDRDGMAKLYIDGGLVNSADISYLSTLDFSNVENVEIGREGVYDTYYLKGQLDEITLWGEVLPPCYVMHLYTSALPDPVAVYHLDEGSGSTAYDATDNDNDGTIHGGASWTNVGKVGKALSLDGTDDHVDVPDSPSLDTGTTFSVEAWFKTDDVDKIDPGTGTKTQTIVMYGWDPADGKNNPLHVRDGKLYVAIRGYGAGFEDIVGVTPILSDVWYHTAFTYDGTTARLYLNGELEVAQAATMDMNTNSRVLIGKYQNPLNYNHYFYFDGLIDEVYIWPRALSPAEVAKHYDDECVETFVCEPAMLNVKFASVSMNFVDQDGDLTSNPDATGNERVLIDYVGYKADGDEILVPLDSAIYFRAYYEQFSGLYGPKDNIMIDGSFEEVDVQFKTIEFNFCACELTGDERVLVDYVGYVADGEKIVVPLFSTIYYRAYYEAFSGLYGPKLSEYVDCDEDIIDVEFWTFRVKVIEKGSDPEVEVTGGKVLVDYVGYLPSNKTATVPVGSTIHHRAYVGSVYSAKHSKLVDKSWNLIVYEWDGANFYGPYYYTEVNFKFYDQNGPLSSSPGYTGNERAYVHTIAAYVEEGDTVIVTEGTTVSYSAYFKPGGLHGPVRYTNTMCTRVMFQTAVFDFKDQDGDISGASEKVYVHSVAQYYEDGDPITVPLDCTISYSAYYTPGGLHGPVLYKTVTSSVEIILVNYQTFTFQFKDQHGNDLAGTGSERVYVHSIAKYVNDNEDITVPLDSNIAYTAYYTMGGLHGPVHHKTIDNTVVEIEVVFKIITFAFKDQYGNDLVGTDDERVYVHSIGKYVEKDEEIAIPLDAVISYSVYYTVGGLHGPVLYETISCAVETIEVVFQIITFEFKDQYGADLVGTDNERVYVHSIGKYVNDGEEIIIPWKATIAYSAYYTPGGLHGPVLYKLVDTGVNSIDVIYQVFTFEFKDQFGSDLVIPPATGSERVYVHSIAAYKNDGISVAVPRDANIAYSAYYTMGGLHGPTLYKTIDSSVNEVEVVFRVVMFDFKDLAGEDLEGTGDERVYVHSVALYYEDGDYAVYPQDSTISYQAYFSPGVKSGGLVYEYIHTQDTIEVTFDIYNNKPPEADAGPDQAVEEGDIVQFDGSGTTDPDVGDILTYTWDFGDGSPTASGVDLTDPTHVYDDEGTYVVELTVVDDHLAGDTDTMTVEVSNAFPVVMASNDGPVYEGSPATVSILATDKGTYDTLTYYYDWENDGVWEIEDSASAFATHTWYDNDDYVVKVGAKDNDGALSTTTTTVEVVNADPVVTPGPDAIGAEGTTITIGATFTDDGTLDTHTAEIDWGDSSPDTEIDPATSPISEGHEYSDDGIYVVTITVEDDDSGSHSDTLEVTVTDEDPTAAFSWDPEPQKEGSDIQFTDESTSYPDDIVGWEWEFGGLDSSTDQNPKYAFDDDGYYAVTLTVTDDDGSEDSISHTVTILDEEPTAAFHWTPSAPVEGSLVWFYDDSTSPADSIIAWDWDFGGLGTSNDQNPSFTFINDGAYLVELTVTDDDGDTDSISWTVTVSNFVPIIYIGSDKTIDEGTTFIRNGHFVDPGADTWTAYVDYGEGAGYQPLPLSGKTFQLNNLYEEQGIYLLKVKVEDDDGVGTASIIITVNSVAPVVYIGGDKTINEGTTFTRNGHFTDPGADTWTATVDYGEGAGPIPLTLVGKTFHLSNLYEEQGTYTLTVEVTDDDGEVGTKSITITVNSVAPIVYIGGDKTINEGTTFTRNGHFTDPGADTWTATVNYGEGAGDETLTLVGKTFHLSNLYEEQGTYTLTVTVEDDDGEVGTASITITVNSVAPVVYIGSDKTINEGTTFTRNGHFTDPGADTWTATVDYGEGAGAIPLALTGKTFHLSNLYEEQGTYTLTVEVKDDDGEVGTASITITVNSVAPVVYIGGDKTINEGTTFTRNGHFTDPGADTWTATVDYGEGAGAIPLTLVGKTFHLSNLYEEQGTYTLTVEVKDDDGEVGTKSITITVNSVAPVVYIGSDKTITEGTTFTRNGHFTDPGADTWTGTVDYGEGAGPIPLSLNPDKTFTLSNLYENNGIFSLTVKITDDDGEVGTKSITITVNNVAPQVFIGSDKTIDEGTTFTRNGHFTDPGADTWTGTVDYGEGAGVETLTLNLDKTFTLSNLYEDNGVFTITVTVTDSDGDYGTESIVITVNNVNPTVFIGADKTIDEGTTFTRNGHFTDPGDDSWTATVDYGEGAGPIPLTLTGQTFQLNNLYEDNGVFTLKVVVTETDPEVGTGFSEITITVNNVNPVVYIGSDKTINEGTTFIRNGHFTDPGDDSWTATVDYGEGAGPISLPLVGQTFQLNNLYEDNGVFTLKVVVTETDPEAGTGFSEITITVNNVNPVVYIGSDKTINEGTTFIRNGHFTDPGDDSWTATVDYGEGAGAIPLTLSGKSFQLNNLYEDNGVFILKVVVTETDPEAGTGFSEITLTVNNVNPVVYIGGDKTIDEGTTFIRNGHFTDPGDDSWTATVDYGEGAGAIPLTLSGKNFVLNNLYEDNGVYTLKVVVTETDPEVGTGSAQIIITVNNVAPKVYIGSDKTIDEGTTFTRNGHFTDPGDDSWTATVDYGEGAGAIPLTLSGKNFVLNNFYEDNGVFTLKVVVTETDPEAASGFSEIIITVNNVAPTVYIGSDKTINEGDTFNRNGHFTDPGDDSWTATVDYGDGTGVQPLTLLSKNFVLNHVYADNGVYTLKVVVTETDPEAASGSADIKITVNNVAPKVYIGGDKTIDEGDTFIRNGHFTDPGDDSWTATVDYGEGAGPISLTLTGKTFQLNNLYDDNGVYTLKVVVTETDPEAASGSAEIKITVNNVAPMVFLGPDATIDEGDTFIRNGYFTDPGDDSWTATVDYGEGAGVEPLTLVGKNFVLNNLYEDNNIYNVEVIVTETDPEAASGSDDLVVTVNNLPPDLTFTGAHLSYDGYMLSVNNAPFTDPGILDWHTATIDWGEGAGAEPATVDETIGTGVGTVSGTKIHNPLVMSQTITVTVTDKDGDSDTESIFIITDPGFIFVDTDNNVLYTPGVDIPVMEWEIEGDGYIHTDEYQLDSGLVIPRSVTVDVPDGAIIRAANRITIGGEVTSEPLDPRGDAGCIFLISKELTVVGEVSADSGDGVGPGRSAPRAGTITIMSCEILVKPSGMIHGDGLGTGSRGGLVVIFGGHFENEGEISADGSDLPRDGREADGGQIHITVATFINTGEIHTNAYSDNADGGYIVIIVREMCGIDEPYFLNEGIIESSGFGQRLCRGHVHGGKIWITVYGDMDNLGDIKADAGNFDSPGDDSVQNGHGGMVNIIVVGDMLIGAEGSITADTWGEKDPDTKKDFPKGGHIFIDVMGDDLVINGPISAENKNGANGRGGKIDIEVEGDITINCGLSVSTFGELAGGGGFPKAGNIYVDSYGGDIVVTDLGSVMAVNHVGDNGRGGTIVLKAEQIEGAGGEMVIDGAVSTNTAGEKAKRGFPKAGPIYLMATVSITGTGSIKAVAEFYPKGVGSIKYMTGSWGFTGEADPTPVMIL